MEGAIFQNWAKHKNTYILPVNIQNSFKTYAVQYHINKKIYTHYEKKICLQ